MDSAEVRAIEARMTELTNVRFTDVNDYVIENQLINLDSMEEITAKATNKEKMRHLFLLITRCPRQGTFKRLLGVLRDSHHEWLADELENKLTLGRPKVRPDSGIELDEDYTDAGSGARAQTSAPSSPSDSPVFGEYSDDLVYISHDSPRMGLVVEPGTAHGRHGFRVKELRPHGLGERSGDLQPNDLIYSVNGSACSGISTGDFMQRLCPDANREIQVGRVRPQVCWLEKRSVHLRRRQSAERFGLRLVRGVDRPRVPGDCGVYVAGSVPGSPADRAGLFPRDTLLAVKGVQLSDNANTKTIEQLLRGVERDVIITIERRSFLNRKEIIV